MEFEHFFLVVIFFSVLAPTVFAGTCPSGATDCFLCGGVNGIPCSSSDSCTGHYEPGIGNIACACPQGKSCECYCPYTEVVSTSDSTSDSSSDSTVDSTSDSDDEVIEVLPPVEIKCANGEVELNSNCVKESEACTGEHQLYEYHTKSCVCDLGYYIRNNNCIMPARERKNKIDGLDTFAEAKVVSGQAFTKTYTFHARPDAESDTVFYMADVWPSWFKGALSISPPKLYLAPGESGTITVTVNTKSSRVTSDPYFRVGFIGLDDKYQYVDRAAISLTVTDPQIESKVNEVIQENTEICDEEVPPLLDPPSPTETTGNFFEDVKRAMRTKAFGKEDAAKIESTIDLFSQDPEGEKDLITALAAVGLIPDDQIGAALSVYASGATTTGELAYEIAKAELETEAENKVVYAFGFIQGEAKDKVYKNLAKVLPQLLNRKYEIEKYAKQAHESANAPTGNQDEPIDSGGD